MMETSVLRGLLCFALFLGFLGREGGAEALSDEKRLIKHLLDNYARVGIHGRPVGNKNDTLSVTFKLSPIQILELDEDRQTISALVWYHMTWSDILLKWEPSDFDNIDKVQLPSSSIFTPDIMAYFELPKDTFEKQTFAVASSDGTVHWVPPVQLTTLCPGLGPGVADVTCNIKIGSWTLNVQQLDLKESDEYLDMETYVPNDQWDLVDASAERKIKFYDCCPEGYVSLNYSFKLKKMMELSSNAGCAGLSVSILLACIVYLLL